MLVEVDIIQYTLLILLVDLRVLLYFPDDVINSFIVIGNVFKVLIVLFVKLQLLLEGFLLKLF